MLIQLKEEDIREAIDQHIDMFGEYPENFNTILKTGLQLRKQGFDPIYLYDDVNATVRVDTAEILD